MSWRGWARRLRQETIALYYVSRDPRTPGFARLVAVCVVAYALSPIDLVPDFVPVIGYLDDLILIPAGIWLALKLTPDPVLMDARERARQDAAKPVSMKAAAVIVVIWVAFSALAAWWAYRTFAA